MSARRIASASFVQATGETQKKEQPFGKMPFSPFFFSNQRGETHIVVSS